ncbi:hypothetical protein WMY93_033606 [Mugilogobius chulae]|uniref:Uncharacterized protein n=1 Tax=Mugilogobius chulae TaxID=88201 RepID=A0AAW0MJN7_9GOBI
MLCSHHTKRLFRVSLSPSTQSQSQSSSSPVPVRQCQSYQSQSAQSISVQSSPVRALYRSGVNNTFAPLCCISSVEVLLVGPAPV